MALLEVTDLKTYFHTRNGVVRAVDGVSFSLEKGKTIGIVGESGSGKSVTCYSMLGLIPMPPGRIEGGTAMFDGKDLLSCSAEELRRIRGKRIAMIFQDPMTSLNPYLRISTQVIEPLLIHDGLDKGAALERAIEAMAEVGIPDPEQRIQIYPHEFSGGMRQRVMIAMALITAARGPDRGRADHRARRHGPGADPRPDQGAQRQAGCRRDLHHPRPRGHLAGL